MRRLTLLLFLSCPVMFGQGFTAIRSNSINCSVAVGNYVGISPGDIGAQINAAQAAGPIAPCASLSEIVIESGTWLFSTQIVVSSAVTIRGQGQGSMLVWNGSTATAPIVVSASTSKVYLKDFTLASSIAGVATGILWTAAAVNSGMSNVQVGNSGLVNNHGFLTGISVNSMGRGFIDRVSVFMNQANDVVSSAVGISILNAGSEITIIDSDIRDGSANSTGSICLKVNQAIGHSMFGGEVFGCTVGISLGTSGVVTNFQAYGVRFTGKGSTPSSVDIEIGPNAVNSQLTGSVLSSTSGQNYLAQIDSGSSGTRIIGSSFSAYAICGINNLASSGATTWSLEDSQDLGACTVSSNTGLMRNLNYSQNYFNGIFSLGPNQLNGTTSLAISNFSGLATMSGSVIVTGAGSATTNNLQIQDIANFPGIELFSTVASVLTRESDWNASTVASLSVVNNVGTNDMVLFQNGGPRFPHVPTGTSGGTQACFDGSFNLSSGTCGSTGVTAINTSLTGNVINVGITTNPNTWSGLQEFFGVGGSTAGIIQIVDSGTVAAGIELFNSGSTRIANWNANSTSSLSVVNSSSTNDLVVFQNGGIRVPHTPTGTTGGTQACWDGSFNLSSGTCGSGGGVTAINTSLTGNVINVAITNVPNTFTAVVEFSLSGGATAGQIYLVDVGTTAAGLTLFNNGGVTRVADWNANSTSSFSVVNSSGNNDLVVFQSGTVRIPHITASGSGGTAVCIDSSGSLYKAPC